MDSKGHNLARIGQQLKSITIAFLTLSWVFVGLRVWTRSHVKLNLGWDDFTMVLATITFTAYCCCILYIEARGGGTHVTNFEQLDNLTQWVVAGQATYIITVLILKISLAIFFLRIVIERWHRGLIYTTITVTALSSISAFFYSIFRCGGDVKHYATMQLQNQCTSRALDRFFAYEQAAFAFLTDCVFVVLPIMFLWSAQMELRSKVLACLILSLATLGCICSAIRFQFVDGLTDYRDYFWSSTNVSIWSTIEPGTGIIAGCMATLRPLMKQVLTGAKSIRTTISRSSPPSDNSSNKRTPGHLESGLNAPRFRRDTDTNTEDRHGGFIEMTSNKSKGDSTECILAQASSWPSRRMDDRVDSI